MKKNQSASTLPAASWAHKYGVSKQNNGSALFGLNPNLNIEDEYIENLLKQIHFMNMEIKLLKEKQQQSNGNSLWGVINRVNEPLVKNIVDSNQKYQFMKKQIDTSVNKTEYENMKLADQQNAMIKKMNYMEQKIGSLQNRRQESMKAAKDREGKLGQKIEQYQSKLKNILAEKEQQNKKLQEYKDTLESLTCEVEKQAFHNNHEMSRIRNDQQIQQIILNDRNNQIATLKAKIKNIKDSMENSQQFQRAKEDQAIIKENMQKVCKNIASAEFELLQINQAIKLAQNEKERQVLQRKNYMEQYESLKTIFLELKTLNFARITKETQLRMRESVDIQKGQYQTKKLEKNLEQIKKKLFKSEQSEKVLRQEVEHMERELAKLKSKKDEVSQNLTKIVTENDKQDTLLTSYKNQYRKMDDQFEKIIDADLTSNCQLNEIQAEIIYLRERKDYLSEILTLKETMNQTKLQELHKMVQKNNDVNETVSTVMEKWEQIRKFSKM